MDYQPSLQKGIDSKGFSPTYKDNEITYSFVTDPVTRVINTLINMKQNHMNSLQLELFSMNIFDSLKSTKTILVLFEIERNTLCYVCRMDPPWIHVKGRGRGRSAQEEDCHMESWPVHHKDRHTDPHQIPQLYKWEKRTLINKKISSQEESSSSSKQMVNLNDIPLYAHMQAYLEGQKQKETFSSIAKEDADDIRSYEKLQKKEMIFLIENSDLQRKDELGKIFQRYLINRLYYPGESYKTRSYYKEILISSGSAKFQHFSGMGNNPHEKCFNFSKIIIKQIISVED
ncbi:hypothetical protein H5410_060495 [Solanum commersonii]|uniref:Uncharacterized protein n=1 Tax=Solanum commersonii TaxID=4109 RepID=A0A9J5W5K6_SOLCO|nr:hypothetical protein H5410_060495 [Solanum commersonii]